MLSLALVTLEGVPPRFRGGTPFPNLADWRADAALFASQALRARAATDGEDRGLVQELAALALGDWERAMLSPQTFAFLADEPRRWLWSELADELDRDGLPQAAGRTVIYREPGRLFEQLLRMLGRGSRRDDCAEAAFLAPDHPQFGVYAERLCEATALVEDVAPGFAADMDATVHAVAFVDDNASFRGSSGVIHRGLILLSPTEDWTPAVFAEELVHETTHNLLDILALRHPLLTGTDVFDEKYAAPFRPDKRHVYGNFHALIVVSRLILLFDAFRRSGVGDPDHWTSLAADYAVRAESALQSVRDYPGLSAVGRVLVENLAVPAITPLLAVR